MKLLRSIAVLFLLALLFSAVAYSFFLLHTSKSIENYLFFGGTCLLTVIVYMTTILDFRISGGGVGVERAKNEIYAAREDVIEIANNLIKMSAIVADGSGRFGGFPKEHQEKVDEYIKNLRGLLSKDIEQKVITDVQEVNEKISARNKTKEKNA